jgi:hypothetical protein
MSLTALALPRPSRAYYLTYLVFGYTAASLFVNRFYELSIQDMIATVVPIGTFVGAFLFYLRPELALLRLVLARSGGGPRWVLSPSKMYGTTFVLGSPYLADTIAYATGAFYFSLAILSALATLPLPDTIRALLILAVAAPTLRFAHEARKLPVKARLLARYYVTISVWKDLALKELDYDKELPPVRDVEAIQNAMLRGDWIETDALLLPVEQGVGRVQKKWEHWRTAELEKLEKEHKASGIK